MRKTVLGMILAACAWPLWAQGGSQLEQSRRAWLALSPESRLQVMEQFQRFQKLSPQKRRELLERWNRFTSLSPEKKERLQRKWSSFRSLPPEKRRELSEKWRKMSLQERRLLLKGRAAPQQGKAHDRPERPQRERPPRREKIR